MTGNVIAHEAEVFDRSADTVDRFGGDPVGVIKNVGDRPYRDSRLSGNVFDTGGHDLLGASMPVCLCDNFC